MNIRIFLINFFSLSFILTQATFAQKYELEVDLQNVINDKVKVICNVPQPKEDVAIFIFPNVIPGTYSLKEYGRYIDHFVALDENGKKLKIKKADKYNYTILDAKKLRKIEYYVNDTWEEKNGKRFIFQPGGTNIESGKNFVVNNVGFFGYIEGMKNLAYEITFKKPTNLKAYSYLNIVSKNETTDVINAANYDLLADSPILYCQPQEASFKIGDTEIGVCLYSENNKINAQQALEIVKPLAHSLEKFFGKLPVDKYLFMFYLADPNNVPKRKGKGLGSGFGALEHNHCSFYFMPEVANFEEAKEMLSDVCAHEFLHILTPLNIHSEEIESFNFRTPTMSQHLWMYEGVTEYFSQLALMQDSLMDMKKFMGEMRKKIIQSEKFDEFSMTEMSKNVLTKKNQARYLSVYSRGAILAMMLDILIIDKSEGKNSLKQVMMQLANKYGPSKPFNDNDLIKEFESITYPEVGFFLKQNIVGTKTPDYKSFFNLIGYNFSPNYQRECFYFGSFGLGYNEALKKYTFEAVYPNLFKLKEGDVWLKINDTEIDSKNYSNLFDEYFSENYTDKKTRIEVLRNGKKIELEATPQKVIKTSRNYIYAAKKIDSKSENNLKKFIGVN